MTKISPSPPEDIFVKPRTYWYGALFLYGLQGVELLILEQRNMSFEAYMECKITCFLLYYRIKLFDNVSGNCSSLV